PIHEPEGKLLGQCTNGKLLCHSENRTRAPGLLPNPGCRPARLVRLHRRILQSSAASFRSRVYHPRTGRAPSRLIQCPPNRGKVITALAIGHPKKSTGQLERCEMRAAQPLRDWRGSALKASVRSNEARA